jgi:hypothetical protein
MQLNQTENLACCQVELESAAMGISESVCWLMCAGTLRINHGRWRLPKLVTQQIIYSHELVTTAF